MFQLVKKNSTVTLRPLAPLIKSFSSTPSAHARPDSNMDLFLKDLNSTKKSSPNTDQFSSSTKNSEKTLEVSFKMQDLEKEGVGHIIAKLLNKGIQLTNTQQDDLKKQIEEQLNISKKKNKS